MESINEIKLDLIKIIASITDPVRLKSIYHAVESSEINGQASPLPKDKFDLGQVEIRSGISKADIFAEQAKQPITFEEVQQITGDEPCEETLEELLSTLD